LHDLNLAAQYADRVIILKRGKLLAMGAPCDVLTPETIRAAFDIEVGVIDHPYMDCPLIVPVPITVAER
jgi:iron complex transport system ATP-binding protein